MDLEKIENLVKLMRQYGLDEIEVGNGEEKIRLKDAPKGTFGFPGQLPALSYVRSDQAAAARTEDPESKPAVSEKADKKAKGRTVKCPFVGTFYIAPSPGAEPFVSVGQRINKGDTLCIVEAMKLMNEIEAEFSGTITEILVENETPVEFDQPLFVIE